MKLYKDVNVVDIKPGTVLISHPLGKINAQESYRRSVILILENDFSSITGVIINKPSQLNGFDAFSDLELASLSLYFGGDTNMKDVHFLHAFKDMQGVKLGETNLYLGGDFNALRVKLRKYKNKYNYVQLFAGHVRWSYDQLLEELQQQEWFISSINPSDLFNEISIRTSEDKPMILWNTKLINAGSFYAKIDAFDPHLN